MRSLVILYSTYLCLHSTFLYISTAMEYDDFYTMLAIECFVILLGGVLATFVIPAKILFIISIILYVIGIILQGFSFKFSISSKLIMSIFGLTFGLFKFLFIVIVLDQLPNKWIKLKLGIWFIVDNLYMVIVYAILPPYGDNILIVGIILLSFNILTISLVLYCIQKKIIFIDSNTLNLIEVIRNFTTMKYESATIHIISISKSVIVFLILLAYGMCDSNDQFVNEYQPGCLINPKVKEYWNKQNVWTMLIYSLTSCLFLFICLLLYYYNFRVIRSFYSNMQLKIIVGNLFMILSTVACGVLETYRLNSYDYWPIKSFNQTANITVFSMVPQICMLSLSETLVIPTCYAFIYYFQSMAPTKYLSVALITSTIGVGGLPDVINMILYYSGYLREPPCVTRRGKASLSNLSHLEILTYSYCVISVISLLVSIGLMRKFQYYFTYSKDLELSDEFDR